MAPATRAFRFYRGLEGKAYREHCLNVPPDAYRLIAKARSRKFQRHVPSDASVFEYGLGCGFNLAALECRIKAGYDIAGPNPEINRAGVAFFHHPKEVADRSFDIIICHHVLEHVESPSHSLREMRRILLPQGLLLLNVPYEQERKWRRYDSKKTNRHLFSWNPQTLGTLVRTTGFEVESIELKPFAYDRFAAIVTAWLGLNEIFYLSLRRALQLLRPQYEITGVFRK